MVTAEADSSTDDLVDDSGRHFVVEDNVGGRGEVYAGGVSEREKTEEVELTGSKFFESCFAGRLKAFEFSGAFTDGLDGRVDTFMFREEEDLFVRGG